MVGGMVARVWSRPASTLVVGVLALLLGTASVIGADFLWLVALGDDILEHGRIPGDVPFAEASSDGWPNVLVAAEVLLALVWRIGPSAPLVLGLVVSVVAWALLVSAAVRRGAGDVAAALVLGLVVVGSLPAWGVVRLQVLSILPFLGVLWILREDDLRPGRKLWAVPVVIAGWGNLHGAVLVGVCVTGAYLLASRLRTGPGPAIAVGVATVGALFVNPAGLRTLDYYVGVLRNEAAAESSQLWAALDLGRSADRLLAGLLVLLVVIAAGKLRVWEWVVVAGLFAWDRPRCAQRPMAVALHRGTGGRRTDLVVGPAGCVAP